MTSWELCRILRVLAKNGEICTSSDGDFYYDWAADLELARPGRWDVPRVLVGGMEAQGGLLFPSRLLGREIY